MSNDPRFRFKLLAVLIAALVGGLLGELYSNRFYPDPNEYGGWGDYLLGFRNGAMIAAVATALEAFYMRGYRVNWVKRLPFLPAVLLRILAITVIIRLILVGNLALTSWLTGDPAFLDNSAANQVRDTLFSLAGVVVFVSISQLGALIGGRRFVSLLMGRYFRPVEEERVFVFVDLIGSSTLARTLGDVQFHEFLSEFFWQVDRAIQRHGGEIVAYVGDAVIVTWMLTPNRQKNARCVRAVSDMVRDLNRKAPVFERQFGHRPRFRAALHGGRVVVGECGDSRRQLAFLGDAVNVTARIEGHARALSQDVLISCPLLDRLDLPDGVTAEAAGSPVLRGQVDGIALCRLEFT